MRVMSAVGALSVTALWGALLGGASSAQGQASASRYDVIIRGGTVVDGSGRRPYQADVAVQGDAIAAVGDLSAFRALRTLNAEGLIVAPGFINVHSHADASAVATATNMLTQGVTTEIANADGSGDLDLDAQFQTFSSRGLAVNLGFYVGFNAAWESVVGRSDRRPSEADLDSMRGLVRQGLTSGAWGVSAGLDYKPAYFARPDEVVSVLSAARAWRTNFPNHERLTPEHRFSSFAGVQETIALAEAAGVTPVITHIKSQGREQGNATAITILMSASSKRGLYTAGDVYPYLAGYTSLAALLVPDWAQSGGEAQMLERFRDGEMRPRIAAEVEAALHHRFGGPAGAYDLDGGQELTAAMAQMKATAGEAVLRLLESGSRRAILRFGAEADLETFLRNDAIAVACDCGAVSGQARGHPRNWGSYPRVLGLYVRERRVLSLESAVRKMTALPAAMIGAIDRGYVAPGMRADITIFDPQSIADHATFENPSAPSTGVRHVLVNGVPALLDGVLTGSQGGRALRRGRHMPTRPTQPDKARRLVASTKPDSSSGGYRVSLDVRQGPGATYAAGRLMLHDPDDEVWLAERFGVLQAFGADWASVTAVVRDRSGRRKPVIVTLDGADPLSRSGAAMIVEIGTQPPWSGPARYALGEFKPER
jgi:N-acyl-D-aspartate/D-glutamate deacylase